MEQESQTKPRNGWVMPEKPHPEAYPVAYNCDGFWWLSWDVEGDAGDGHDWWISEIPWPFEDDALVGPDDLSALGFEIA